MGILPKVQCKDSDGVAFAPGKKKQPPQTVEVAFIVCIHRRSELYKDGVIYKALVHNLRAQFKYITPPERPLHVTS